MAASLVGALELIVPWPRRTGSGVPRRGRGLRRSPGGNDRRNRPQPADARGGTDTPAGRRVTLRARIRAGLRHARRRPLPPLSRPSQVL